MDNELSHIGTKYSGRYPKGSGDEPNQRNRSFLELADSLKAQGLSRLEIAKGCGMNTAEYTKKRSLAKMEIKKEDRARAEKLRSEGLNDTQIGVQMNRNESSVRLLFNEKMNSRNESIDNTANILRAAVKERGLIDVGLNSELYLGVSRPKLKTALSKLEEEGYQVRPIYIDQLGTGGNKKTTVLVLSPPVVYNPHQAYH
jgi:hypothetical protein